MAEMVNSYPGSSGSLWSSMYLLFTSSSLAQTVIQIVKTGGRSRLLNKLSKTLSFTTGSEKNPIIEAETATTYQAIDVFSFSLTQVSLLLQEFFDPAAGCPYEAWHHCLTFQH